MIKRTVIFGMVFLVLSASMCHATIKTINATDLSTSFTAGTGELSVTDTAEIVVEDISGTQMSYPQGQFDLTASLQSDTSSGTIASGLFDSGTISFADSNSMALLTGDNLSLEVLEVFDGAGILSAQGEFEVTGGSLQSDFALPEGEIVQIVFSVSPASISDFSSDFTGSSNITTSPIPEPMTISLLALGGLGLLRRKKQ